MRYLTYIKCTHVPKNRLEAAINKYIRSKERLILDHMSVRSFQEIIEKNIQKLNVEYPRCTPVKVSWEIARKSVNSEYDNSFADISLLLNGHYNIVEFKLFISP